jgi:hypothetical protein
MASAGSAALTSKNIFSFLRQVKVPQAGELREPISLVRSERVPTIGPAGEATVGFDQKIDPYYSAWSKVFQSQQSMLDGQNTAKEISHVFLIRNFPGLDIQVRDYVIWQGKLFAVRGTRNLDGDPTAAFIMVVCDQGGAYTEEPRTVVTDTSEASDAQQAPDNSPPIWIA